jgi:hypothetical protein
MRVKFHAESRNHNFPAVAEPRVQIHFSPTSLLDAVGEDGLSAYTPRLGARDVSSYITTVGSVNATLSLPPVCWSRKIPTTAANPTSHFGRGRQSGSEEPWRWILTLAGCRSQ